MNEVDIIKGCQRNDRNSQKQLYEAHYGKILGVCLRYSNTLEEAKEMLRESFLKIFTKIKSFNSHTAPFEEWMKKIAINTSVGMLRKNKHNYLIVSTVKASEKSAPVEPFIADDEFLNVSKEDLLKALQELTPAYRSVFNLFLVDGFSHKEIIEILDVSEETLKSNLSKAKFNVKKNLMHLNHNNGK